MYLVNNILENQIRAVPLLQLAYFTHLTSVVYSFIPTIASLWRAE